VPLGFLPDDKETVLDGHAYFPAPGLPFGLAFTSSAFTEAKLLNYAFAFEQQTQIRLKRRAFHGAIPKTQLHDVM
jgi:amidase